MTKSLGVMIDCSRNGVMRPEKVKEFAELIAECGYNMLMLYTEDTYEISDEPFFGYMRGRYTKEELKELDAYCKTLGIELVPCIQTLAHLKRIAGWPDYKDMFDLDDVLLAGDERVYRLIDRMFETLEECFTTRRAHIGMDEAHMIGLGKYLDRNGYRDRTEILCDHLKRVNEIARKHGFSTMIWSDMFVRLNNHGAYYGDAIEIPQSTVRAVPKDVELIYWDYYSKEKAHYDAMLKTHSAFRNNPVGFAGGVWTWCGYAPHLTFSLDAAEEAMKAIAERPVSTLFFTLWGDNGKDCSYFSTLPVLFAAAEMARGTFSRGVIAQRFEERFGYGFSEFLALETPNLAADERSTNANPCKYLLFNDPFLGLFDHTVTDGLAARYRAAAEEVRRSVNGRRFDALFDFTAKLLDVLSEKCDLGIRIRKAYGENDREALRLLANGFRSL